MGEIRQAVDWVSNHVPSYKMASMDLTMSVGGERSIKRIVLGENLARRSLSSCDEIFEAILPAYSHCAGSIIYSTLSRVGKPQATLQSVLNFVSHQLRSTALAVVKWVSRILQIFVHGQ